MNKIISYTVFIIFLLLTIDSSAQNPYFGVKAGLNLSHMKLKDDNRKFTKDLNFSPGINIGGTMDYRVFPGLTINTSLLFSTKGYMERTKEDFQGVTIKSTERLTLFYIDLPLFVKYEFELGLIDIFAGAGGFIGYGYWGKHQWRREGGGEKEWNKSDVLWGDDPEKDDYLNLDYGVGLILGAKLDNFVLEVGYNYSIANISAPNDKGQVARNGLAFASVSYYFSRFYKYGEGNY